MLNIIMLNVITLNAIPLNVIPLNVIMTSVVAPCATASGQARITSVKRTNTAISLSGAPVLLRFLD
jgi:hypothetical protein